MVGDDGTCDLALSPSDLTGKSSSKIDRFEWKRILTFCASRWRIEVLLRFPLRRLVHWAPHRPRLIVRILIVRLIIHKLRWRRGCVESVAVVVWRSLNWPRRWPSLVLRLHVSSAGVLTTAIHPVAVGEVARRRWRIRGAVPLKSHFTSKKLLSDWKRRNSHSDYWTFYATDWRRSCLDLIVSRMCKEITMKTCGWCDKNVERKTQKLDESQSEHLPQQIKTMGWVKQSVTSYASNTQKNSWRHQTAGQTRTRRRTGRVRWIKKHERIFSLFFFFLYNCCVLFLSIFCFIIFHQKNCFHIHYESDPSDDVIVLTEGMTKSFHVSLPDSRAKPRAKRLKIILLISFSLLFYLKACRRRKKCQLASLVAASELTIVHEKFWGKLVEFEAKRI